MTTNWSFDPKFIEMVIKKGYVLLEDPKMPKSKKKNIRTDIATFKRFLSGDFENKSEIIANPPQDIERLKSYILTRMAKQYKTLGEELIIWTMDLCYEEIFKIRGQGRKTTLSLDEQVELTMENYQEHSPHIFRHARPILKDDVIHLVQEVPNLEGSSYCYHDEITDLPYLIINPNQAPWVVNHETEHAIEEFRRIIPHKFYSELGPILFETLFNDMLYKQQGFLNKGDYSDRIKDTEEQLLMLFHYFDIMLVFAGMNFQVPTDVFLQEFQEICEDETETGLKNFLREEIAPADIVDEMSYLYSYLKAIELREGIHKLKQDCTYTLDPYIKTKKFDFTPRKESFAIYRRFTEEMQSKTKKS